MTPFGIFLPEHDDLWLYMARSKVTSDFIVDRLEQWWQEVRLRFLRVKTLVINLDNGPENHSRRTQFLKRIVEFARKYGLVVQLAYYPPYHVPPRAGDPPGPGSWKGLKSTGMAMSEAPREDFAWPNHLTLAPPERPPVRESLTMR